MSVRRIQPQQATAVYNENHAHLRDELRKLDLLIQLKVALLQQQARRIPVPGDSENMLSRGMYISDAEVAHLLSPEAILQEDVFLKKYREALAALQNEINAKVTHTLNAGVYLALPRLAQVFALSSFEVQAVLICLAPELQRKYDKLYAYLQDDITRKKPSVDLILELLCVSEAERWKARAFFSKEAPLFRAGLLQTVDDPQSPSGASDLARFLKLDPRILNFLVGNNQMDERLLPAVRFYAPVPATSTRPPVEVLGMDEAVKSRLFHGIQRHFSAREKTQKKMTFYFHGVYGTGKKSLARAVCAELNCALLVLDVELLAHDGQDIETLLKLTFREGLLQQSALYLDHADLLFKDAGKGRFLLKKLSSLILKYGWLTFLAGECRLTHAEVFQDMIFQCMEISLPDPGVREKIWEKALTETHPGTAATWAVSLAGQFKLTPGQIQDAVRFAKTEGVSQQAKEITLDDLYAACRNQSNQKLNEMGIKIQPNYGWDDLILPEAQQAQLREICEQVKHQVRVFNEWGFGQKLSHGKGLSLLFSGPPGTGKTMAAEVIAHELKLDLYKMDLSALVSKYIGETEKNLAKVFREAETSNAILFFDEADALFGKRTEVSDAHDRYANIETSYLLQKMEEYEGVVILATNLRDNMDEAFTRRIRFIVEFPFPDAEGRKEIWRRHFPDTAPVSDGLDYDFLSKKVQVAGGNIKNIVLNAAFLAAQNGQMIGMEQLLKGAKREYEKIGKLWDARVLAQPEKQEGKL